MPVPSPIVSSQAPASSSDDSIRRQFTNFADPRQTPVCVHSATPPRASPPARLSLDQLKNAEYLTSDGYKRIQLINGTYLDPMFAADRSITGSDRARLGTHLLEPVTYGDVDANGTEDAIIVLSTWGGGTGFWRDAVIVLNEDGTPRSVATIFFSDRDVINTITVVQGDIVIDATMHWTAVRERKAFRLCNNTIVLVAAPAR